jgi:hypothetical protein
MWGWEWNWLCEVWTTINRPEAEFFDEIQSWEFSSLLFTVSSTALPWDFYFFKLTQPLTVSVKDALLYGLIWLKKSIQKPQVKKILRKKRLRFSSLRGANCFFLKLNLFLPIAGVWLISCLAETKRFIFPKIFYTAIYYLLHVIFYLY